MRRLPVLLLTILAAAALSACSAGAAPGWTYAPAASATPAPSGAASGGPSAGASTAPSGGASGAPSAAPSGGAAGLTITAPVGAATGGFDPTTAETAAGTAFTLTFDNVDNTSVHNLVLQNPDGSKVAIQGDTTPFTGPGKREYQVPALTAGAYKYVCEVHVSTMTGTLTVK